ncbi:MAG: hypothetical protein KJ626_15650 [Verrucomicrobia bacterium]|nr:hypothetical protein [Verrucomicrobiota bacterium]
MRTGLRLAVILLVLISGFLYSAGARDVDATAPRGVTMAIYDSGFALVTELRQVTLSSGENRILFKGLPAELLPSSVSFSPVTRSSGLDIVEQQFVYDLANTRALFDRYRGEEIEVQTSAGLWKGKVLSAPEDRGPFQDDSPLAIQRADGTTSLFPDIQAIEKVSFLNSSTLAFLEPSLIWQVNAERDGPQNLRLNYSSGGLEWHAAYEMLLNEDGSHADLMGRVGIANNSGVTFKNARIKLVTTERGALLSGLESRPITKKAPDQRMIQRYAYGSDKPTVESAVLGETVMADYSLARPVTLEHGTLKHVQHCYAESVPVKKFFTYDGVKFDTFQQQRRNDWNYGTEYHTVVEAHLEFNNTERYGLGVDLPAGDFRLYRKRDDGSVDLVGEDRLQSTKNEEKGYVLLGAARGISGERERTGYSEVTPLHEYEESFEIRLSNDSEEEAEIRVIEHMYRWDTFEIVKADGQYELTGPNTIEFRPVLKPGGRRSLHYTVKYSW